MASRGLEVENRGIAPDVEVDLDPPPFGRGTIRNWKGGGSRDAPACRTSAAGAETAGVSQLPQGGWSRHHAVNEVERAKGGGQ
jgi:hypothetical protein